MAWAAQDASGSWYCLRCFQAGFRSQDAVRGHRRSPSCKAGLGGVQDSVDNIRDRQTSQSSGSAQASKPAAETDAQPLRARRIPGLWAPPAFRQAFKPAAQALPGRPLVEALPAPESDSGSTMPCPGCIAMGARIERLEADLRHLADVQSNHLEHALGQTSSSGISPWVAVVGAVAVIGLGAWALGVFDPPPASGPHMGKVDPAGRSSGMGTIGDALEFVGRAARAVKSVKGLF